MFVSTRLLNVANSRSLRPLSLSRHCIRVHKPLPSLPVHPSQLKHSNTLVQLVCPFLLFGYGFLELLVEVVDLTVIMTRCWCINLYDDDIERSCSLADRY